MFEVKCVVRERDNNVTKRVEFKDDSISFDKSVQNAYKYCDKHGYELLSINVEKN